MKLNGYWNIIAVVFSIQIHHTFWLLREIPLYLNLMCNSNKILFQQFVSMLDTRVNTLSLEATTHFTSSSSKRYKYVSINIAKYKYVECFPTLANKNLRMNICIGWLECCNLKLIKNLYERLKYGMLFLLVLEICSRRNTEKRYEHHYLCCFSILPSFVLIHG